MMYNYGAAILRAVGDTKRPLIFLIVSGVINAVLNLFLVIGFHLDVAGVGLRPLYPSWYPVSWYSVPASHREQLSASPCKASDQIRVSEADF